MAVEVIASGNYKSQFLAASARPRARGATTAMKLDAGGQPRLPHAVFQVLNGSSEGLEMPVMKAVTTFGKPGVSVVAVSHRRDGYYVAYLDGTAKPLLNGDAIADVPVMLSNHDVLELAGTRMLFMLKD